MTHQLDVARSRDTLTRWCALAEARLEHLTELFETGRWRRYHSEVSFLENIQEAKSAVLVWRDLASRGWVVYLETSIAQQAERAGRTRHRPLLHGTDPTLRLEELMRAREPLYREIADLCTSTDRRRVRSVAERIAHDYKACLRRPAASASG